MCLLSGHRSPRPADRLCYNLHADGRARELEYEPSCNRATSYSGSRKVIQHPTRGSRINKTGTPSLEIGTSDLYLQALECSILGSRDHISRHYFYGRILPQPPRCLVIDQARGSYISWPSTIVVSYDRTLLQADASLYLKS